MRVHLLRLHVRRRGRLAVIYVYVVLGAAGLGGLQLVRAHFFPWKRCPTCKGTKRVQGMGGFKICTRCDKEGKVRRWGAPGEGR